MYLFYLLAWKIIGLLPEKLAYKLANRIADFAYRKDGKGVRRLRSNYRRVMPSISLFTTIITHVSSIFVTALLN